MRRKAIRPAGNRKITVWQLLTLGGLLIALTSLFRTPPEKIKATGIPRTPASPAALQLGFEPKDIDAHDVTMILAAIAASTALVIGIVFVMVWRFDIARGHSFGSLSPQQTARSGPPAPQLQSDPVADLARQYARENRLLHSYGWTSADHSTARIPIDRAMALSVGQSLDTPP